MIYEQIAYEVSYGVATITPKRPAKLNGFTHVMRAERVDSFDTADAAEGFASSLTKRPASFPSK